MGDGLTEDRDTQDAQREAGGSISAYMSDDLTAARGNEERGRASRSVWTTQRLWTYLMILDKVIVAYDMDSDDSDAYTALRNKPKPKFKHPEDRNNRASLTRKEPGSPGKC